jgi:tetratricopeptide (TPR) repeat protein
MDATLARRLAATTLAAALCVGCAGTPLGPAPHATEAYERGDYNVALVQASDEYHRTRGKRRDTAALIAGLSAHALDRNEQAAQWLEPLVDHPDREISARAAAGLGLVRAEQGDHEAAAALLSEAGRKLRGDAAARANFHAAESYAAIGRVEAARLCYRLARVDRGGEIDALASERLGLAGYAVQLGAFRSRTNAEALAGSAAGRTRWLGLGEPRVVVRETDTAPWYLVQVGAYDTESAAEADRPRLGPGAVVVATGGGS